MVNSFQRMLNWRGVHWLVTRFGPRKLRSLSFDEKFKSGVWRFDDESPGLARLVEKHAAGGHILVMGCGSSSIATQLSASSFESLLGVDISAEALQRSEKLGNEKVKFQMADMLEFRCPRRYDVILFAESLYYVRYGARRKLLKRMSQSLTPLGRIIVVIARSEEHT